ncbi:MAG: hypothetical protein ACRDRL_22165 [Sciscionella sp.]
MLLDRGHTAKILRTYAHHVNNHRPHQGRHQLAPQRRPHHHSPTPTPTPDHTPPRRDRPHQRVPQSQLRKPSSEPVKPF